MLAPARVALLCALALAAGCVDPTPEWERVEDTTRSRVAGADLVWEQSEEDARLIEAQVAGLLQGGLSREEAVQVALLANRRLQAIFEEVGVAKARLVQAQLPTNPTADGIFRFPVGGGRTAVESGILFWVSDLWVVPLRGLMQQYDAAATLRQVEGAIVATAVRAAIAHDAVLYRQLDLALQRDVLGVHEAAAQRLQVRFASGQANDQDVYEAEARVGEQRVRVARAERDLVQARARLGALLNLDAGQTAVQLTGSLDSAEPRRWTPEEAWAYALEHRLDVAQARAAIEQADWAVDLERARIFDQVRAGGDHEGRLGGDQEAGPALSLELPLFDQNQAQIARAEFQLRQATKRLQAIGVEVRRQVSELLAEIEYRRTHLAVFQGGIEAPLVRAAEYAQRFGDLMRLEYLHLYEVQDHLLHARREYLRSVFGLRRAHTLLQGVLLGSGRTAPTPMGFPELEGAFHLDPEAHTGRGMGAEDED